MQKSDPSNREAGGGGGSDGGGGTPPIQPPPSEKASALDDVAARYLNALIDKMQTKEGDEEKELMERIERLLKGRV